MVNCVPSHISSSITSRRMHQFFWSFYICLCFAVLWITLSYALPDVEANFSPLNADIGDPNLEFQENGFPEKSWLDNSTRKRFVAVGLLNIEQLTKSRKHLGEVLAYAHSHNRTLILPFCGNGIVGSSVYCHLHLSAYFNIYNLGKYVDWVTEKYYETEYASNISKVYYLTLMESNDICDLESCSKNLNPFFKNVEGSRNNFGCVVCGYGKSTEMWKGNETTNADLLVITKKSYHSCIEGGYVNVDKNIIATSHLTYSSKVLAKSKLFINQFLGPHFLAVHWRMELAVRYGESRNGILKYLSLLQTKLYKHRNESNISGIFIATDVSWNMRKHYSNSLVEVKSHKRDWMMSIVKTLREEFNPPELEDYEPSYSLLDSGIRGLFDKLICAQSTIFLYPSNLSSSHLSEILELRKSPSNIVKENLAPVNWKNEIWDKDL